MALGVKVYWENQYIGWLSSLSVAKGTYTTSFELKDAKRFRYYVNADKASKLLVSIIDNTLLTGIEPLPKLERQRRI